MKYVILFVVGLVLISFLVWFFIDEKNGTTVLPLEHNGADAMTQVNTPYGFAYTYRDREYRLFKDEDVHKGDLVHMEALVDADDFEDLNVKETPREGDVALTMMVFKNPMHIDTREWITKTDASNYKLSFDGTISTAQLGNTDFLTYQFDGLYRTDAYAYGKDGYIYLFFNAWDNPESAMKKDMESVLTSLQWSLPSIPASVASGDIVLHTPALSEEISSPLMVEGKARGGWYFEATFPIVVVDWDGRIIGEGYAEAQEDWMTEAYVPFKGEVSFEKPEGNNRGALILKKSNPSGLPQNDDAIELPIIFK